MRHVREVVCRVEKVAEAPHRADNRGSAGRGRPHRSAGEWRSSRAGAATADRSRTARQGRRRRRGRAQRHLRAAQRPRPARIARRTRRRRSQFGPGAAHRHAHRPRLGGRPRPGQGRVDRWQHREFDHPQRSGRLGVAGAPSRKLSIPSSRTQHRPVPVPQTSPTAFIIRRPADQARTQHRGGRCQHRLCGRTCGLPVGALTLATRPAW